MMSIRSLADFNRSSLGGDSDWLTPPPSPPRPHKPGRHGEQGSGDFYLATSEDFDMATSEDFLMATDTYERMRNPLTSDEERDELKEFQQQVCAHIQVPDGALDIPDFKKDGF
jgi:hypothetical protein